MPFMTDIHLHPAWRCPHQGTGDQNSDPRAKGVTDRIAAAFEAVLKSNTSVVADYRCPSGA
jgi:hypothetical protein